MNPLKTMPKDIPSFAQFGSRRKYDVHTGIDLHCQEGTEVFAIESGIVKKNALFTGGSETPWWNDTSYLGILGESGYIIYGEIETFVQEGDKISEGQLIGKVKRVLKHDKGTPTSMLHLELYSKVIEPVVWHLDQPQPMYLLDPNVLLKKS